MNEFSPEQPQAARQFSSSCAESHAAQQDESGLSIEPTPSAKGSQSTMPTQATHRIAFGESDAKAPAGLHTKELAGSHDCEQLSAPTGQGSTASCEAKADRALPVTITNRKLTNTMTIDTLDNLAPGEDGVQEQNSCPKTTPTGSNVVAASCGLSPVIDGNIESTTPVSPETKAGAAFASPVNTAPPDESEQVCSPQAESPSVLSSDSSHGEDETSFSSDSITPSVPAGQCIHMSVRGDETTNNNTNTMSTNNDIPTVPADDESAATQMNNATAADVESATGSSTTNNSAAAIAFANLNSGTDCATTYDTTMNIDSNNNDGIALASNEARATDSNAPRSESNSWYITVPECDSATISVVLGADDLGSVSVGPISLVLGPRGEHGGGPYTEVSDSASIKPGTYKVSTTYSNITLPEGMPNVARFKCQIKLNVDGTEIEPEPVEITPIDNEDEGDSTTCPLQDCGCNRAENGDGDNGEPNTDSECGGNAGALGGATATVFMTTEAEETIIASSSSGAGRQTNARGGLLDMLWRMNFATFRGMAGIPDGVLEIRAREFTSELYTPSALAFNHPFDTQVLAIGGTSDNPLNGAFQIRSGSSRVNYFCFADGLVSPLAGSAKRGGKGNMISVTNTARNTTTRSLSLQDKRGGFARYDADDNGNMGMLSAYTTKSGRTYESADISSTLQVIRDEDGAIAQLWNAWDGLMVIDSVTETGYRMAFYLPHQVGAQDITTKLFAVSGSPWRTVVVAGDVENATLQMTDTVLTREPQVSRFIYGADGAWSTEQGSDSAKICRHVARELIEQENESAPEQYRLVTTLHRGDINSPDECVAEIWQTGATGNLCISRTLGYGSPGALTSLYEYDSDGRLIKEISPSGAVSSFTYDDCGREMVRMTPYHGNHTLAVYTYYRESGSADPDISYRRAVLNETATQIWREDFTYEEQDGYRRVTKSTQALGCTEPRVEITETWLDTAEEELCRGRQRMRQGVDGVQTWYSYEACNDFGAVYKVTAETRFSGEAVPTHSRREMTYISAVGNNMRHEVYRLLSNGTWALTESESYEYDCENNWVKRTRGNGRVTTRTMMCCGPLSVTDEDGVTTTYGYNAAHQLEEVIRSEVQVNGVVITPETITTYTRDAADRILSERKDIGPMTTVETTQYDLIGREVARTDILNRTTTIAYSEDGLTTIVTSPSGATFITTRHADGMHAAVSGTGQRSLVYEYNVQDNALCTTVRLADEAGTLLSQTFTNSFGQTMQQVQPTTTEALLRSISEYNVKGQLVKQWQSSGGVTMAPTLYEYDSFGDLTKQTLALTDEPNSSNSPIKEFAYTLESTNEGVFFGCIQTKYNASGNAITTSQKQLISQMSANIEEKVINIDERGLLSTDWIEYNTLTKRTHFSVVPTSVYTAQTVSIDGFICSQSDTFGITTTALRRFEAEGLVFEHTDGRGNTTTTKTDIAGRILTITDAAGNTTSTSYSTSSDYPVSIIDAMGNSSFYRYDIRDRKVAEWGSCELPACFGYDDADNMISLKTFRAGTEIISSDPTERTDGDETTWSFDAVTGLELVKTHADNTSVVKTYDSFNRLSTETDARGIMKTHSYETARGLLLSTIYSDGTTTTQYTYNHLGQVTQVIDDAGVRTIGYNAYEEQESDSLLAGGVTHFITEIRDTFGRSSGFIYAKNGEVQHTVSTGYSTDGRIASAGFMHGGEEKLFSYSYLPGSNLLQTITMPCNMTLTQSYEEKRDLLISMAYHRSATTLVTQRNYSYDVLARPLTRSTARNGQIVNDNFVHNSRSEIVSATVNGSAYGYDYDNIGNRRMAMAASTYTLYEANNLNQYSSIQINDDAFLPTFDMDGNQTLLKSSTGIWNVEYNAENRPIRFTNNENNTVIHCSYDSMGRRVTKKVMINDAILLHQRYIYRGFQQIACCDLTRTGHPCLWLLLWEVSQNGVSRPLAILKDGSWYAYGWDISKNICEIFGQHGYIRTTYSYSPFGEVFAAGDVSQSFQWSSEFYDSEIGLVYYNYRYYNPNDGRWICGDFVDDDLNDYRFVGNSCYMWDDLGLSIMEFQHLIPQRSASCMSQRLLNKPQNGILLVNYEHKMKIKEWDEVANKMAKRMFGKELDKLHLSDEQAEKLMKALREEAKKMFKHYAEVDNMSYSKWSKLSTEAKDSFAYDFYDELDYEKVNQYDSNPHKRKKNIKYDANTKINQPSIDYRSSHKGMKTHPKKAPDLDKTAKNAVEKTVDMAKKQARKKAAKVAARVVAKTALKAVPFVGWGIAIYGAYEGYKENGFTGAVIGFFF